eukprot:TRINITY_DN3934_c0_g1_i1.p3 TRINITY_DN3934_c0_g1~~TRINITY_DN3934_c0_g1_i1.p3  ORF type:complete len:59 (+),score=1.19 TRINITY_DN3934_c0_g1_i1:79-255(+)
MRAPRPSCPLISAECVIACATENQNHRKMWNIHGNIVTNSGVHYESCDYYRWNICNDK